MNRKHPQQVETPRALATMAHVRSAARKTYGEDAEVSGRNTFEGFDLCVSPDGIALFGFRIVGRTKPEACAMALAALRVRAGETS